MPDVAVVAHSGKSFGGGLRELRQVLAWEGVTRAEAATTARSA